MGLAQRFLQTIDAWAKSETETGAAHIVAPLINKISPIVTEFAIGNNTFHKPPSKTPYPDVT